jgi:hypothetical protein
MPVRRLVVIALVLAGVSGCGGSAADERQDDPGRATLGAFLHAAAEGDTTLMRGLLSLPSSSRISAAALSKLATKLRPLARRYSFLVSERITDDFGLAAVRGPVGAYAAALRKEGEKWRLELSGPIRIMPLGPDPGAREPLVQQIAAEVKGGSGNGDALLYLDGLVIPETRVYSGASGFTVFANLPAPVLAGRRSIVAFAHRGGSAAALAWTFSVLVR